jgi:hypothetical protein
MIAIACVCAFVGLVLLVGGGEYAKSPPGRAAPLPRAFGWWLRFVGATMLLGSIVSVIQAVID